MNPDPVLSKVVFFALEMEFSLTAHYTQTQLSAFPWLEYVSGLLGKSQLVHPDLSKLQAFLLSDA